MSRQLPARPNLEYLRNEAKELLLELKQQRPEAALADAQHALARAYGFASWPRLKAHVESIPRAEALTSPLAGLWIADVARSKRHPANLFRRATIDIAIAGEIVTITDVFVDEHGRSERGVNMLHADGVERPGEHGYALLAAWRGSHRLEALVKKDQHLVTSVTYDVSTDAKTLTITNTATDHVIELTKAVH